MCKYLHIHKNLVYTPINAFTHKHIEPAYLSQVAQTSSLPSLVLLYLASLLGLVFLFPLSQISQTLVHIRIP